MNQVQIHLLLTLFFKRVTLAPLQRVFNRAGIIEAVVTGVLGVLISAQAVSAVIPMGPDCEALLVSRVDYEGDHFGPEGSVQNPSERLYREFLYQSTGFLADRLRWPNSSEAVVIFEKSKSELIQKYSKNTEFLEQIQPLTLTDFQERLKTVNSDFPTLFPNRYFYLRRTIASFFIRAVRQVDLEKRFRTVPTTPSDELFFLASVKPKSNGGPQHLLDFVRGELTIEHFKDLYQAGRISQERQGIFPQPLLFTKGLPEIEAAARFDAPGVFHGYVDTTEIVNEARAERTIAAIEKSKGFIAVSWSAGKPLSQEFLAALLQYVEQRDFVILIGATQQIWDGVPALFLTHPRIHLLTHSIENATLKISNEPINPDIENPLAGVKKVGRYQPGQTVIVFHPHQMLEAVPTVANALAPVVLMSTGSINEPFAPYTGVSQGRTKEANKVFHKQKAFVFEKGAKQGVLDPSGAQNIWHYRPVQFFDDRVYQGTVGFIDRHEAYQIKPGPDGTHSLEKTFVDPVAVYLGDPHDPVTDPFVVSALLQDLSLPTWSQTSFLGGDTFDFGNISRHDFDKMVALNLKVQSREIFALEQVNGTIQMVNALLQRYPNARYLQIVGNHDEWLTKLLDQTPDIQRIINGDFLDELSFVVKTLRMNVWEYIFKHRENILKSIMHQHPDKKAEILRRVMPVYDASRIDVLDRGTPFMVGPEHRKNDLANHGDRASYGVKFPSLKAHAKGMPGGGGVTGHTHTPGIYGEVMDPGALAPISQSYGKGFASRAGQGLVVIYPNGTKQLWVYNPRAGAFHSRGSEPPPPERFFAGNRFKVIPNDNQRVDKAQGLQAAWQELERLKALTAPQANP